jgi:hypothetical protein
MAQFEILPVKNCSFFKKEAVFYAIIDLTMESEA